jgi:DNA-binding CsgD family transcriptional regulator
MVSLETLTEFDLEPSIPIDLTSDDYTPDITPYSGLLWAEIRIVMKQAHLSAWQAIVFEWWVKGFTLSEIATILQRSKSTIQVHLQRALTKIKSVPYIGLITTLIETFGFQSVRDTLDI